MTSTSSQVKKFTPIVRRIFIGIALLALLVTLVSTVFLDSLARLLLTPSFKGAGIELQSVNGLHLRPGTIHLRAVQFRFADSLEPSLVENLTVHFNWRDLLDAKIDQVHVESVTLALGGSSEEQNTTPPSSPQLPSLAEIRQQLDALPVPTLSVNSLTIAPYIEAATLTLQPSPQSIAVNLSVQDTQLDLSLAWLDSTEDGNEDSVFTGTIVLENTQEVALSSGFTLAEQSSQLRLESSTHVQTETLQTLLSRLNLPAYDFALINGAVNFDLVIAADSALEQPLQVSLSIPAPQRLSVNFTDNKPLALNSIQWIDSAGITVDGTITWPDFRTSLTASAPEGQIAINSAQSSTSTLSYSLNPFVLNCQSSSACEATLNSNFQLDTFSTDELSVDKLLAITTVAITVEQEQTRFELAQGSRIEAGSARYFDTTLLNANMLAQAPLHATLANNGDWLLTSNAVDIFVPDLISAEKSTHFAVALEALQGSLTATGDLRLESKMHFRNIGSDWLALSLRNPETTLVLRANNDTIDIRGDVRLASRDILQLEAQWAVLENTGAVHASSPELAFAQGTQSLSQLFYHPPFTGDLLGGSLQASATLEIALDSELNWLINGPISLTASQLSGFYEDVGIINLSTHLQGAVIDGLYFKSAQDHAFTIERIDVGLPVEHIAFNYGLDTENTLLSINDFEASLFNGKVNANALRYDWSAPSNQLQLRIERLDVSRMLDLAAYDSVQATGYITGTLPITLTGYTPSVEHGALRVEAPGGVIRYSALGGAGSNASIDFVNQTLSNYQYDVMETDVNYQPSGELDLGVRLQGSNPDMNNGQRINLNLNINDNIPALLQSLQSGRSIADALERAIQSQQ